MIRNNLLNIVPQIIKENSLTRARSYTTNGTFCICEILEGKVEELVTKKQFLELGNIVANCQAVKHSGEDWKFYYINKKGLELTGNCRAIKELNESIQWELIKQKNIKYIDKQYMVASKNSLPVFILKTDAVTLAGTGGAIAKEKDYKNLILKNIRNNIQRPLHIVSIGGAQGHDAVAIARLFHDQGFDVKRPIVVDPNPIAAYLSQQQKVDYYLTTAQEYFAKCFLRRTHEFYLFHLGTTLNVVDEDSAAHILQATAEKMVEGDILSLVIVDEKAFTGGKKLSRGNTINYAGFVKYIFSETGKHYKTVIGDRVKFLEFMEGLGLQGEWKNITSSHGIKVIFFAYKAIKI